MLSSSGKKQNLNISVNVVLLAMNQFGWIVNPTFQMKIVKLILSANRELV